MEGEPLSKSLGSILVSVTDMGEQAVFLIFGGLTIAWGLCLIRALPDVPTKAGFLSAKDRTKAVARVSDNLTGIKSDEFKWYQCREAFLDVKLWLLFLIQLSANIGNGGVHSVRRSLPLSLFSSTDCLGSLGPSSSTGWGSVY